MNEQEHITRIIKQIRDEAKNSIIFAGILRVLVPTILGYAGIGITYIMHNIASIIIPNRRIHIEDGNYELRIRGLDEDVPSRALIDSINKSVESRRCLPSRKLNTLPVELVSLMDMVKTGDFTILIKLVSRMRYFESRETVNAWLLKVGPVYRDIIYTKASCLLKRLQNTNRKN